MIYPDEDQSHDRQAGLMLGLVLIGSGITLLVLALALLSGLGLARSGLLAIAAGWATIGFWAFRAAYPSAPYRGSEGHTSPGPLKTSDHVK